MDISGTYLGTDSFQAKDVATKAFADKMKTANYENATDEQLMDACKQFEGYFVEQVMKEMMKTVDTDEDSVLNNKLVSYFMDSAITQMAETVTDQESLGLAQKLYNQMKLNYGEKVIPAVSEE